MTELLAVLGTAALFALFGWFMRGRRQSCGREGACPSLTGGCAACRPTSDPGEPDHAHR